MLEFHEIEELFKSEELIKSRAALKALLRNAAMLRQEGLTPEQKQQAEENIKHIAATGTLPKATAPKKEKPKKTTSVIKQPLADTVASTNKKLLNTNKINPTVEKALNSANILHQNGDVDGAHTILSAIPKEHLPDHLKNYDPVYMHYNVTPSTWKALSPEHQGHVTAFHNEVMSGHHDSNPDLKPTADKVKSLIKPIKS